MPTGMIRHGIIRTKPRRKKRRIRIKAEPRIDVETYTQQRLENFFAKVWRAWKESGITGKKGRGEIIRAKLQTWVDKSEEIEKRKNTLTNEQIRKAFNLLDKVCLPEKLSPKEIKIARRYGWIF